MTARVAFLVVMAAVATRVVTHTPGNTSSPALTSTQSSPGEHPHLHLTTAELIAARGYPAEAHHVVTSDGYILEIHRIPHGRRGPRARHTHPHNRDDGVSSVESVAGNRNIIAPGVSTYSNERSSSDNSNESSSSSDNSNESRGSDNSNESSSRDNSNESSSSHNSSKNSSGQRKAVFVLHGFLSSSADFVMNDPDQALGFLLADAGFDVWLGNTRGNFYGRRHTNLTTKQPEFWDFSWNELSRYDVPAMLSYVRKTSRVDQVSYIGHSMGTSLFFAMMDYHPHINTWVRAMAALAPAAYVHHKYTMAGVLAPFFEGAEKELRKHGIMEIFRLTTESSKKVSDMCGPKSITSFLCVLMYFISGGPNSNYLDKEYLPVIFAHTPAGSGLKVFTHLRQLHASRKFQAYDHGEAKNLVKYGRASPPQFSLAAVRVPVGLFWSENDWIVDPRDVRQTASELPWVALDHQIKLRDFNHVDFLWAENANYYVYDPTIRFLDSFL
ncbi:lipase 3 [Procambarus clarkii]|uniref:lipase 3 n=1 Tax=Procambarus clarkii TaxID=6728 RepID=UPI001E672008|nr:lipase 3-like [Procambarus clarkii]